MKSNKHENELLAFSDQQLAKAQITFKEMGGKLKLAKNEIFTISCL
jgi:hypothetical protein